MVHDDPWTIGRRSKSVMEFSAPLSWTINVQDRIEFYIQLTCISGFLTVNFGGVCLEVKPDNIRVDLTHHWVGGERFRLINQNETLVWSIFVARYFIYMCTMCQRFLITILMAGLLLQTDDLLCISNWWPKLWSRNTLGRHPLTVAPQAASTIIQSIINPTSDVRSIKLLISWSVDGRRYYFNFFQIIIIE